MTCFFLILRLFDSNLFTGLTLTNLQTVTYTKACVNINGSQVGGVLFVLFCFVLVFFLFVLCVGVGVGVYFLGCVCVCVFFCFCFFRRPQCSVP